jgi:FkbM family methyltransferase
MLLSSVAESFLRGYSRIAPTERGLYRLVTWVRPLRPRERWIDTYRTADGVRLRLDLGIYPDYLMAYGFYELETVRLIRRLLAPGDHFVDVGANIGYLTLLAAKLVGAGGRVDAFEPQPDNRQRLNEHLALNGASAHVHVHAMAVGDREGETTIYLPLPDAASADNHGMSSIFPRDDVKTAATVVPMKRLDDVLSGTSPRLIKIDVEGAEPFVVDGMTGLLSAQSPPAVIMEHNPMMSKIAGFSVDEGVRRLLAVRSDYKVWRIHWRRLELIADPLRRLPDITQCNLLLAPPGDRDLNGQA